MKRSVRLEDIKTLEEMAKELGLSEKTVDRWRLKGMPVISIDKYVRAWMPEVLEWLVRQKEASIPEDG